MTKDISSNKQNTGFLSSIIGKLSIISIGLTGIGILINNMYLLGFGIVDFNLLQPRNIFTGITFVIYLFIYYIIFQFKLDFFNLKKYSYVLITSHLIIKFFIIINGLFYLLRITSLPFDNNEYLLFSKLSIGIPGVFLFIYLSDAIFTHEERNTLIHRISFPFFKWLLILMSIFVFVYSYVFIPEFKQFAQSQTTFLFLAIAIFLSAKNAQAKIEMAQNGKKKFEPIKSFFTENHFDYDHIVEKFFKFIVVAFFIVYGMYLYSSHIHSNIPTNFGGAQKSEISLELSNGKKVKGELIFQNENKYYVQKERELLFIKKDDVAKIYLIKK
ncbi:hypothetical protein [uncultured Winogradskyella sp.]|uniref:hypothetical protein n=1 Tax=uncultured Winogradskyella sp. TaxID=395353 RepID=UPI00261AC768|nr:hypothetical protein [uncultured Winogradskyella sp.]